MDKKRIAVVFGGQSGEHEVSCVSAYNVIKNIDKEKFEIVPIGITKEGVWNIYHGDYKNIESGAWKEDEENLEKGIDVFSDTDDIDIFFPVLHGPMGEDGTIQGVFEMLNKPYVGCGVLASSVGMDKILSKIAFEAAHIPSCRYEAILKKDFEKNPELIVDGMIRKFSLPIFVKPANLGSSVGITKAHTREELLEALKTAFDYDRRAIAEEFVDGREIECAVLEDGDEIKTARPGEIIASKEFYDYEAKYHSDGASVSVIPAEIPDEALDRVEAYAKDAFEILDASGLSRVDFFYVDDTGDVMINEINTLPGFTPISMYAMMWENSGLEYGELIDILIAGASNKKTVKKD